MTTFQRARNPEQKDVRIQEITQATRNLLVDRHFNSITLKQISESCSFSRINIYNYFKTKEEIFLTLYLEDLRNLVVDLTQIFKQYTVLNPETFASLWSETLHKHQTVFLWHSLVSAVLLPHSSEAFQKTFMDKRLKIQQDLLNIVKHGFPQLSEAKASQLFFFLMNFGAALYIHFDMNIHHDEVDIPLGFVPPKPSFFQEYRENIIIYIKGLV